MPRLTDDDRAEIEFFADFLRRVGSGPHTWMQTAEGRNRMRAWVAEDPEERLEYLGLPDKPEYRKLRAGLLSRPEAEAGEEQEPAGG